MPISPKTRSKVFERDQGKCQHPSCPFEDNPNLYSLMPSKLDMHHIYWRSQYRKRDRDDAWNIILLHHMPCHEGERGPHMNKAIDKYFKSIADNRLKPPDRAKDITPDLQKMRRLSQKQYQAVKEHFMKTHSGLTPLQYAYRQKKKKQEKSQP